MTGHTAGNDGRIHHPRCGSIQCADCYPGWGDLYNEAVARKAGKP